MLIPTLFLLFLASSQVQTTETPHRLHEIEKLLERFDSFLDVNYIFYDVYRAQKRNPLLCKGEYGPYCSMINKKSILDGVLDTHDNPLIQGRKDKIVSEFDEFRQKGVFGLSNHGRDNFLKPLMTMIEESKEIETIITFEEAVLNTEDSEISNALIFEKEKGIRADIPGSSSSGKRPDLKITFEKLYVPAASKVTDKKTTLEKEKADKANEAIEKEKWRPVSVYAYSKTTEVGVIHFSKPVIVKQIWARKHNKEVFEEQMKAEGKNPFQYQDVYDIRGESNKGEVVFYAKDFTDFSTKWTLMKVKGGKEEEKAIDRLVISENTDVDNMLLGVTIEEEKRMLSMEAYHDLMRHLGGKLQAFSNLENEDVRKTIMKNEAIIYLKRVGFDPEFMKKLVDNMEMKKIGNGQYDISFIDIESFVNNYVKYKTFMLQIPARELAQTKDMIRIQLRDSNKKVKGFEELSNEDLKQVLDKLDKIGKISSEKEDDLLIVHFQFEDKSSDDESSSENVKKGEGQKKPEEKSQDDL